MALSATGEPKIGSGWLQYAPKRLQERLKRAQKGTQEAQDRPKGSLREPKKQTKRAPESHQEHKWLRGENIQNTGSYKRAMSSPKVAQETPRRQHESSRWVQEGIR
jgi:hypothetical protein